MAMASGALSLLHGFALCTLEADAIAFNSTLTASGEALAWMHVAGPGSMVQWLYGFLSGFLCFPHKCVADWKRMNQSCFFFRFSAHLFFFQNATLPIWLNRE